MLIHMFSRSGSLHRTEWELTNCRQVNADGLFSGQSVYGTAAQPKETCICHETLSNPETNILESFSVQNYD